MKIIHITFSLGNGGKENLLVDIANEQAKKSHDVAIVIINNDYDNTLIDRITSNVKVIYLKREKGFAGIFSVFKLFVFLKFKFRPDVIHCHDIHLGKQLRYITKCKTVITVHGLGLPTEPLSFFNTVFAISHVVKKDIEERSKCKSIVVFNGIYTNKIKLRTSKNAGEKTRIVQVSNLLHQYKGQDILIEAINILVNEKGVKNFRLELIGEGSSRLFLEKMIEKYNLTSYVFLPGSQDRDWIYENLCKYDIFIQASRNEAFGLTMVEAMTAKIPVIASNHGGPLEILDDGKNGFIFENENPADLASKIIKVANLIDTKEITTIIDNAYEHCINNFNIETTAINYLTNY